MPISHEVLLQLQPAIARAARFTNRNGCSEEDLIQAANYTLLTREHIATKPLVTAYSSMKDWVTTYGWQPDSKLTRRGLRGVLEDDTNNKQYKDYSCDWSGINWTETERDVVELYCEEGWTLKAIGELYGYAGDHASLWAGRALRKAALKAADAWGEFDDN